MKTEAERSDTGRPRNAELTVSNLTVRFGGVHALDNLTLTHSSGGVLGLIGPNGAGKTTLLNVLTGAVSPSSGQVRLGGTRISGRRADTIARLGVTRTFQNLQTFTTLSVLDNVLVPLEARQGLRSILGSVSPRHSHRLRARASELLHRVGVTERHGVPVGALPYGTQRRVEVARALAGRPKVLLLDEPLAGLSRVESDELADVVKSVAAGGVTVVLVEHDVTAVMRVSDRVVVLDQGRLLADGPPEEVQADEKVRQAYLGEAPEDRPAVASEVGPGAASGAESIGDAAEPRSEADAPTGSEVQPVSNGRAGGGA